MDCDRNVTWLSPEVWGGGGRGCGRGVVVAYVWCGVMQCKSQKGAVGVGGAPDRGGGGLRVEIGKSQGR